MTIETALCDSFKLDILDGLHSIKDEYRLALYDNTASLNRSTTKYSPNGEITADGYEAGGLKLEGARAELIGGSAFMTFDDAVWERISVTASGCMIYNSSSENRAVAVFNFGEEVISRNGKFTVKIPSAGKQSLICIG